MLLKSGAEVDPQDVDGMSALMIATENGHTEVIKSLLQKGAQVDLLNIDGESALSLAKETEIINLLLRDEHQVPEGAEEEVTVS